MPLQLTYPMMITSRLLPGVHVANALISIEPTSRTDRGGKPAWRWYVDIVAPQGESFTDEDLWGWGDPREMLGALLSFLSACGEGRAYARRTGRDSDNADIFPDALAQWCEEHHEELSIMGCEVEESPECFTQA